jgi:hypothetical protein
LRVLVLEPGAQGYVISAMRAYLSYPQGPSLSRTADFISTTTPVSNCLYSYPHGIRVQPHNNAHEKRVGAKSFRLLSHALWSARASSQAPDSHNKQLACKFQTSGQETHRWSDCKPSHLRTMQSACRTTPYVVGWHDAYDSSSNMHLRMKPWSCIRSQETDLTGYLRPRRKTQCDRELK